MIMDNTPGPWTWKHTELWGTHQAGGLTMDKCILFATFAAHVDVNTANARLIAAAPDLFTVAQEALTALEGLRLPGVEGDDGIGTAYLDLEEQLRAAIAKATQPSTEGENL